jgi:hypothetical protein
MHCCQSQRSAEASARGSLLPSHTPALLCRQGVRPPLPLHCWHCCWECCWECCWGCCCRGCCCCWRCWRCCGGCCCCCCGGGCRRWDSARHICAKLASHRCLAAGLCSCCCSIRATRGCHEQRIKCAGAALRAVLHCWHAQRLSPPARRLVPLHVLHGGVWRGVRRRPSALLLRSQRSTCSKSVRQLHLILQEAELLPPRMCLHAESVLRITAAAVQQAGGQAGRQAGTAAHLVAGACLRPCRHKDGLVVVLGVDDLHIHHAGAQAQELQVVAHHCRAGETHGRGESRTLLMEQQAS